MSKLVVDVVTTRLLRVNNIAVSSGCIVLNSKVINELCIEKDVKRSGRCVIWGSIWELRLEGLQKNTKKLEWSLSRPRFEVVTTE